MMHAYTEWVRWALILAAAIVAVRLALAFWRFRGLWKITPTTSVRVTMSSTPLATVATPDGAAGSMRYGPAGVTLNPTVHTTRIVAHSAAEIPKELLDALTPEQRKLVLEHLPAGSPPGISGSAPASPKKP